MTQASPARPSGGQLRRLFSVGGTVTEIDLIARHMRRIRIEGDDVARLTWIPGQQVRVHVTDLLDPRSWLRPRDFLRTYSVWQHDGGIELCVLDHDTGGPGARWARQLRTGQAVSFSRPEGSFVLRDGRYHLFAGEETAAVAAGAMLRALPPGTPAYGVFEVDGPDDRLPLDRDLLWEYRHGRTATASETLVDSVRKLELPGEPGVAYLAGEARTIQLLRRHLVTERRWPRQAVHMKPFWTPGKRGLD